MADFLYLADMNVSPVTVADLRQSGWDIIRVSEVPAAKSKDDVILHYAREQQRIVITQDLDFSMILAIERCRVAQCHLVAPC